MKDNEEQVLDTSKEAAVFEKNICGWVDRHGRYFGSDERAARWSGCTHIACECGNITEKNYTACSQCREKNAIERYEKKEKIQWDGKVPLYSDAIYRYFMEEDDLRDFLEERTISIDSLRLLICEPVYLKEIDEDYFCDELPEDGELSEAVSDALNNLNAVIRDEKPASWMPGDFAVFIL